MISPHHASKLFTTIIGINKIVLILFLVGFAYFSHVSTYICKNPKQFMAELIGSGLCTAIPVAFISFQRGQPFNRIVSASSLGFLLMFFYTFMTEMAGENTKKETILKEVTESKPFKIVAGIVLGIFGVILAGLAWIARDQGPGGLQVFIEALTVALPGASALAFIAKNHKKTDVLKIFIKNFLLFFVGYFVLQYGGFNKHAFHRR